MRCIFVYKHTKTTKPFSCPATHHHQRSVNSTSDSVEKYVFSLHHLTNDTKEMKKKTPVFSKMSIYMKYFVFLDTLDITCSKKIL